MMANDFSQLVNKLGIKFKNSQFLKQAFIHRSYLNEVKMDIPSNERLEFLGDSILSLIISQFLFEKRSTDSEGDLTNLRAYIVKTKSLAQASKKLELGKYLKLSKGEEVSGGRENPQLLANTYEALLGAVFLDQGMEAAKKMVEKTLLPAFQKEINLGPPKDAKSNLQEMVQEKYRESPYYKTLESRGPDHQRKFIIAVYIKGKEMGKGEGSSKQEAEEKAATQALEKVS